MCIHPIESIAVDSGPAGQTPAIDVGQGLPGLILGGESKAVSFKREIFMNILESGKAGDALVIQFISYAWGGESEKVVNQLDREFQAKGVLFVCDSINGFKWNLNSYKAGGPGC